MPHDDADHAEQLLRAACVKSSNGSESDGEYPDGLGREVYLTIKKRMRLERRPEPEHTGEVFGRTLAAVVGHFERHGRASVKNLRAWVYSIARNAGTNYLRALARRSEPRDRDTVRDDVLEGKLTTTEAGFHSDAELDQALLAALDTLPPRQRELIVLDFFERLTPADICKRMGIGLGYFPKAKCLAFQALRQELWNRTRRS